MSYYGMQFTFPFFIVGSSDHLTGAAGITWTGSDAYLSKDGGAFVALANTPTALQSGWYAVTVTSASAAADFLGISIVPSGTRYDPQNLMIQMAPAPQSFYAWPSSLYQAAPFRSLAGAIAMQTNKSEITSAAAGSGLHVAIYQADDATVFGRQTITQSAGFNPIVVLDTV